jgi:hypothetical protein
MNRFIFINPFQNGKGLNGLPKIASRKSETKTLKKFAGCGRIKFFLFVMSSPKSIVGDPELKAWIPY